MTTFTVQVPKNSSKPDIINEDELDSDHVGNFYLDRDDELYLCIETTSEYCLVKVSSEGLDGDCYPNWPVYPAPPGYVVTIKS